MYRKEYKQQLATITARDQIAAPSCNMRTHAQNEYMPQAKSAHSQRTAMWQPCSTPDHGLRKTPTAKPCRDPCPLITSNPRTPHLPSQNLSPLPTCVQIVGGKEEDRSRRTAFKMMSQSKGARKDNSSNSPESAPVVRKNHSNPRQNAKGKAIEVRHFGREECMDTAKIQNSTRSTHGRRMKPPAQPQRAPHPSPMPTRARPTVGHTKIAGSPFGRDGVQACNNIPVAAHPAHCWSSAGAPPIAMAPTHTRTAFPQNKAARPPPSCDVATRARTLHPHANAHLPAA